MLTDDRKLPNNPMSVLAGTDKRFFVEMLTRDIELLPAIADLVDNSVDGARATAAMTNRSLKNFYVHLLADSESFEIRDNCGGMSSDIARKYAFQFGRPLGFAGTKGSVGQFGIGMKRALFKLGTSFRVESTYLPKGVGTTFTIDADVVAWLKSDEWTFTFSKLDESFKGDPEDAGTLIQVPALHGSVSDDLADATVLNSLRNELSLRHAQSIGAGLLITLNGVPLKSEPPMLQSSEDWKPIYRSFRVDTTRGSVNVRLYAGTRQPLSQVTDEEDASEFRLGSQGGWYIFCNDRLLVAADQSAITGWGTITGAAAYHPQYRNFYGYVFMEAEDASLLPWNTAKTAIDRDSIVYREVLTAMRSALVDAQGVINRVKTETTRANAPDAPASAIVTASRETPNVALGQLAESPRVVAPPVPVAPRVPVARTVKTIKYDVPIGRFGALATKLGTDNAAEVGRMTFEYAYRREVD